MNCRIFLKKPSRGMITLVEWGRQNGIDVSRTRKIYFSIHMGTIPALLWSFSKQHTKASLIGTIIHMMGKTQGKCMEAPQCCWDSTGGRANNPCVNGFSMLDNYRKTTEEEFQGIISITTGKEPEYIGARWDYSCPFPENSVGTISAL